MLLVVTMLFTIHNDDTLQLVVIKITQVAFGVSMLAVPRRSQNVNDVDVDVSCAKNESGDAIWFLSQFLSRPFRCSAIAT